MEQTGAFFPLTHTQHTVFFSSIVSFKWRKEANLDEEKILAEERRVGIER